MYDPIRTGRMRIFSYRLSYQHRDGDQQRHGRCQYERGQCLDAKIVNSVIHGFLKVWVWVFC